MSDSPLLLPGKDSRQRTIQYIELAQDIPDVTLNSLFANHELLGNQDIGKAISNLVSSSMKPPRTV